MLNGATRATSACSAQRGQPIHGLSVYNKGRAYTCASLLFFTSLSPFQACLLYLSSSTKKWGKSNASRIYNYYRLGVAFLCQLRSMSSSMLYPWHTCQVRLLGCLRCAIDTKKGVTLLPLPFSFISRAGVVCPTLDRKCTNNMTSSFSFRQGYSFARGNSSDPA